jgi:hypothetical protein
MKLKGQEMGQEKCNLGAGMARYDGLKTLNRTL